MVVFKQLRIEQFNKPGLYTHSSLTAAAQRMIQKCILTQDAPYQTKGATTVRSEREISSSTGGVPTLVHYQGTKILPS